MFYVKWLYFSNSLPLSQKHICNNFWEQNCRDKADKQYCYKQNQTLPSIICFRSTTNSLKMKSALISFWMNYYYQSRYIRL